MGLKERGFNMLDFVVEVVLTRLANSSELRPVVAVAHDAIQAFELIEKSADAREGFVLNAEWVLTEDRLPLGDDEVLAFFEDYERLVSCVYSETEKQWYTLGEDEDSVCRAPVCWCAMPKYPDVTVMRKRV